MAGSISLKQDSGHWIICKITHQSDGSETETMHWQLIIFWTVGAANTEDSVPTFRIPTDTDNASPRLDMAPRHQQMSRVLWTCNTWDEREIAPLQDGQQYPLWIPAYIHGRRLALPAICGHAPPNCNRTLASATLRNNWLGWLRRSGRSLKECGAICFCQSAWIGEGAPVPLLEGSWQWPILINKIYS